MTFMGGLDVCVQIRHTGESLVASLPCAHDRLALLDRSSRVVDVDMSLQIKLCTAFGIAEHAVHVLASHVRL